MSTMVRTFLLKAPIRLTISYCENVNLHEQLMCLINSKCHFVFLLSAICKSCISTMLLLTS